MWKNTVERDRPQTIIWRMRIACWIPKATNTHSQYVILTAFPLQQSFHERASILRYTYSAFLVLYFILEVPDSIRDQDAKFVTEFSRDLQQVVIAYCPSS